MLRGSFKGLGLGSRASGGREFRAWVLGSGSVGGFLSGFLLGAV